MIQRGEDIVIGVGIEETRGTRVDPQIWIPGRTPTGVKLVVDKTLLKETRASKMASQGSEIVMKRAEGDLEANVRDVSIGFLLKSLLGKCTSASKQGDATAYEHKFEVLPNNPEHPSLTLALSQPVQDYDYLLALVSEMKLNIKPDDLINAVFSFVASEEAEKGTPAYVPALTAADYIFRHQDVSIKIAANVAGLAAASPIGVKEFALDVKNNAGADQNVGEINPGNVLASTIEATGNFSLNFAAKTMHDYFDDNDTKALQIIIERLDKTVGASSHPKLVITLPNITFEGWNPDRPIDDIVKEGIDFTAHYDETAEEGIDIVLTNGRTDYAVSES